MKHTLALAALIGSATGAAAHSEALPHVHGSDAVFFGAVLVLAVGLIAFIRSR